ncbi:MAG: FUSC family protein [Intrasporangium sp.]|uniref:FUSC family protein n=1 Tax=Intrasporangium sp. TaxID=1925024 RepID=UPI003F7E6467
MSWIIARHLVNHHEPFFAPIAAVVALNASRGERGTNAVLLLWGVVVGILVGGGATLVLGTGYVALALATFVAMLLALALGGKRIIMGQAAASAILVVTTANSQTGPGRLIDALIGAGVALVISQLLFPVEPVGLLRRSEAAVLADLAASFELIARAAETGDDEPAERALDQLRSVRDRLTELSRTREHSRYAAHRSPRWWGRTGPIVREVENAGHLDLLGGSCLLLARAVTGCTPVERRALAASVAELAEVLQGLARAPGDRDTRQDAADHALVVAQRVDRGEQAHGDSTDAGRAGWYAVKAVASDAMVFAGVDAKTAAEAVQHGSAGLRVADPPSTPRLTFRYPHPRGRGQGR